MELEKIECRLRNIVGVDLGQTHDPTAIAIVQAHQWLEHDDAGEVHKRTKLTVPHLERLPLGTTYPAQVAYVGELLRREPLASTPTDLIIDHTGVGRPVFDLFSQARLRPRGLVITAGEKARRTGTGWSVSKLQLISRLQAELHCQRLRISTQLKDAQALAQELRAFRVNVTTAGNAVFAARVGAHDDLVLALAIATWEATQESPRVRVRRAIRF
jgi:hypothetical protein